MAEYIEKEEILTYLEPLTNTPAIDIKLHIQGMKTADVQPVRHGRWIGEEVIQCSNCNFTLNGASYGRIVHKYFSYCPKCGARMDGDSK